MNYSKVKEIVAKYSPKIFAWIKKNYVLVSVLIFVLLFSTCIMQKKNEQIKQLSLVEKSLSDSVRVLHTKNGELYVQFQSIEVDKSNLKKALEVSGVTIKELRDRDIKWRNVNSVLQAQIESHGHGETILRDTIEIQKTDTIRYANFKWNDGFLFLKGNVTGSLMKFDHTYQTGLKFIVSSGKKQSIVTGYLTDPKTEITSANSITVKRKIYWYEKPWLWGAAGLVGGYFIAK